MYVLLRVYFVSVLMFSNSMVRCELFRGFVLGRIFLDFNISACYFIVSM